MNHRTFSSRLETRAKPAARIMIPARVHHKRAELIASEFDCKLGLGMNFFIWNHFLAFISKYRRWLATLDGKAMAHLGPRDSSTETLVTQFLLSTLKIWHACGKLGVFVCFCSSACMYGWMWCAHSHGYATGLWGLLLRFMVLLSSLKHLRRPSSPLRRNTPKTELSPSNRAISCLCHWHTAFWWLQYPPLQQTIPSCVIFSKTSHMPIQVHMGRRLWS